MLVLDVQSQLSRSVNGRSDREGCECEVLISSEIVIARDCST